MSLLSDIVDQTRSDLRQRQSCVSVAELQRRAKDAPPIRSLRTALRRQFGIIGEIKERSPSAGEMNEKNVKRAKYVYESSAAITAISVLTEGPNFGGSKEVLWEVRQCTTKPILRKDFIVDPYQIWEARAFGADAVLLMAAVHHRQPKVLRELYDAASSLGMECLVEIGMSEKAPAEQAQMVPPEAEIWGINSRRFDSKRLGARYHAKRLVGERLVSRFFSTDPSTDPIRHEELRGLIPEGRVAVAESGIHDPRELRRLAQLGFDAALIGTAFLRTERKIKEVVAAFEREVKAIRQEARASASIVPMEVPAR